MVFLRNSSGLFSLSPYHCVNKVSIFKETKNKIYIFSFSDINGPSPPRDVVAPPFYEMIKKSIKILINLEMLRLNKELDVIYY